MRSRRALSPVAAFEGDAAKQPEHLGIEQTVTADVIRAGFAAGDAADSIEQRLTVLRSGAADQGGRQTSAIRIVGPRPAGNFPQFAQDLEPCPDGGLLERAPTGYRLRPVEFGYD